MPTSSVREATFEVMRRQAMTTIFSNPGSTEVSFLADLPDDLTFVLALHEGSVVGIATGHAIASRQPTFVLLHTTAGLGNAVGAIATARVNRAPLVVVVGQQDRRHLALEPFLAGELAGLAGSYPLDVLQPARAQDVPSAIERAAHTARDGQGPVVVIVPMDDWEAPADPDALAAADPHGPRHGVVGPRWRHDRDGGVERTTGHRRRSGQRLRGGLGCPHGAGRAAGCAGVAGAVRCARRLSPGPCALSRPTARRPRRSTTDSRRARSRARGRYRAAPAVRVRRGTAAPGRRDRRSGDGRPGRGAPLSCRPRGRR